GVAKTTNERDDITIQAWQSYDPEKCKNLFAEFTKHGTWPVPTLVVDRSFAMMGDPTFRNDDRLRYFSGEAREWLVGEAEFADYREADFDREKKYYNISKKLVAALFAAGIPMLAGTDVGNPHTFPGFSLHDELALRVESGVSPLAALQSAT